MKKLMILLIGVFLNFSCGSQNSASTVASQKVMVKEDAFVQGGNTANQQMGTEVPKRLRIFNSNEDTKYARTGLLKFDLDDRKRDFKKVVLHLPVKVFEKAEYPNAKFHLQVYGTENNWQEATVSFQNLPGKGELLGETKIEQSADGKHQWTTVELSANKFKSLLKKVAMVKSLCSYATMSLTELVQSFHLKNRVIKLHLI